MTALSDEELVAKYREAGGHPHGTPFADELFSRHYSRVALWCLRIAGNRDAAADLAQEIFSKAWLQLEHFRAESKFTTWLYVVTRNHCFNSMKKKGREREDGVEASLLDGLGATLPTFDTGLEQAQMIEVARGMMASELTPIESQVMKLHFSEELPLETITRLLQLDNASGAKAYLVSARRKLKSAVERWTARNTRIARERAGHEGN